MENADSKLSLPNRCPLGVANCAAATSMSERARQTGSSIEEAKSCADCHPCACRSARVSATCAMPRSKFCKPFSMKDRIARHRKTTPPSPASSLSGSKNSSSGESPPCSGSRRCACTAGARSPPATARQYRATKKRALNRYCGRYCDRDRLLLLRKHAFKQSIDMARIGCEVFEFFFLLRIEQLFCFCVVLQRLEEVDFLLCRATAGALHDAVGFFA